MMPLYDCGRALNKATAGWDRSRPAAAIAEADNYIFMSAALWWW